MDIKDIYAREKNAVLHGQSAGFRMVKFAVLIALFGACYALRGPGDTWRLLVMLFAASLVVHFFFRHMSDGWTKSWWLYKHRPIGTGEKSRQQEK